jgi:hypothetical protein
MKDLTKETKKIYSQFNQDSVLDAIFKEIGTTNKYFVEFGSYGDEESEGNSLYLRKEFGFDGLLMDGTEHIKNPKYPVNKEFIQAETINETFEKYNVPAKFDFLSIDIDGEDYYVMKSIDLKRFFPRVVSIETNPAIVPTSSLIQKHDPNWIWGGWYFYGCGISTMTKLMNKLEYSLVAYCGVDAIYVNNEEAKNFDHLNNVNKIYSSGVWQSVEHQQSIFDQVIKNSNFFISTEEIR